LLSSKRLFDLEDVQKAKSLAILKENYVELEVEPRKYVKVGLESFDIEKVVMYQIYLEFSQVIT